MPGTQRYDKPQYTLPGPRKMSLLLPAKQNKKQAITQQADMVEVPATLKREPSHVRELGRRSLSIANAFVPVACEEQHLQDNTHYQAVCLQPLLLTTSNQTVSLTLPIPFHLPRWPICTSPEAGCTRICSELSGAQCSLN